MDLDVGGVYLTFREGSVPDPIELGRVVEASGFELAAIQMAVYGVVEAASSAPHVVVRQPRMILRDPQQVLERLGPSLNNGMAVMLRGTLDLAHTQGLAMDICGADIIPTKELRTAHDVTLPLCR